MHVAESCLKVPGPLLTQVTPVLLTLNEAANIRRTLSALTWARDIVVVDSGSTDETLSILQNFTQVRVFSRLFDTHCQQWQFATSETGIKTPWILRLDADYLLTDRFVTELAAFDPGAAFDAYRVTFDYAIHSKKLTASLYPPNTILLRRGHFSISQEGHTERWHVNGAVGSVRAHVVHDDRKPLSHWLHSQQRYATREADRLLSVRPEQLSKIDRIRLTGWLAPLLVPSYALFAKGCILNGWAGLYYVFQRLLAEILLSLNLIERRLLPAAEEKQ